MMELDRRDFLKVIGAAGASATLGCSSESARTLIPYVLPPEEIIPGEATWFATTCRECPAGCGLLAKNRDGRVIKVEGNPLHPVNLGRLCPRGQASLHGLYNPDRFRGPMKRSDNSQFVSISWQSAEKIFVERVLDLVKFGKGEQIACMTGLITGTKRNLLDHWLKQAGASEHLTYEPLSYEPLRVANKDIFGTDGIPTYKIDRADFLISFGAGFLETWLSNVYYAGQFAGFRSASKTARNLFIYVGPRLSMTAANADLWVSVAPGNEYLVALGILRVIVDKGLCPIPNDLQDSLDSAIGSFPLDRITAASGIEQALLERIAKQFAAAKNPLALAEGLAYSAPNAVQTAIAANLLCSIKGGAPETHDFSMISALSEIASAVEVKELAERMERGEVQLLILNDANPVFSLPKSWQFHESLKKIPTIVSFSSCMDETTAAAHLILPVHTALESWGDYMPVSGVTGFMQPVMGNLFDTRELGDILISSGRKISGEDQYPWNDIYELLRESWMRRFQRDAPDQDFETFWLEVLQRGGAWNIEERKAAAVPVTLPSELHFPIPDVNVSDDRGFRFTAYPSIQFFDGRMANRPWIQELPDPITQTTWGGWIEIHPETAEKLEIKKGDLLEVRSPFGVLQVPAIPIFTVPPNTLAMPIGQGHFNYGRYATGLPANPMELFPPGTDPLSSGIQGPSFRVTIKRLNGEFTIANTDGSLFQHDREIARQISCDDFRQAVASGSKPVIDYPLPIGYEPTKDFYPAHTHKDYRWAMVVDLDRCIGCGACVVACYAENNVAIVGRQQVINGREMSWIRVQRYFDRDKPVARWLVMLCQHCDCAPCESVCPIFAPQHSVEGLNNQVYNRCFGTRFCSQNDPYKVRRFNWFTFTRPSPLDMQLNPDVTVRQKGVMEKCSFCVQRIVEAKIAARKKGRKVQDGDFTTACAQTCPTNALIFGSLKDPDSRVSKLINDPRAYQVFRHLNTKPAVIYLKRVTQEI